MVLLFWNRGWNGVDHTSVVATAEQCLHSRKALSSSHSTLPESRLGRARNWEGTRPAWLTTGGPRDGLRHMAPCSAINTAIEGKTLFQSRHRLAIGWAWVCSWEVMSVMSDYLCTTWHHAFFLHLLNCFLSRPASFLTFILSILSPIPLRREGGWSEQPRGCLAAGRGQPTMATLTEFQKVSQMYCSYSNCHLKQRILTSRRPNELQYLQSLQLSSQFWPCYSP